MSVGEIGGAELELPPRATPARAVDLSMIILDTDVTSELMKPSPSPVVRDWVRARRGDELYTTSITLAEISYGIERLPAGRRRDLLKVTFADVFAAFEDQLLPFGAAAAAHYR